MHRADSVASSEVSRRIYEIRPSCNQKATEVLSNLLYSSHLPYRWTDLGYFVSPVRERRPGMAGESG